MAVNADHHTQKITITKQTVKVANSRDDVEYPKAVKKDGKYVLPWTTVEQPPDVMTNFKYFFSIDKSGVPNEAKLNEEPLMKMMTADRNRVENPPENGIRTTWLGHASVLFQLDNVNILVNPNFNQRGVKYYHPDDDKRYRRPVYKVDDLPRIDCVFVTNTHFDYLDLSSVKGLNERFGDMLLWYVPMGVADWMGKAGCVNVVELDWWKEDEVDFIDHTKLPEGEEDTKTTTFNIACTPTQNYHSRDIDDDNGALWCSWVVISPRYKIFLAGASGYNDKIFKSIGRRYGPFHMAALPIGGYDPDWKFAYGNVTPEKSVQIHQDLLAMCSLAVSWGTFKISNEYYLEPPQRLNDELKKQGLSEMQFFLLKHGESRLIEIKEADQDAENEEHEHNGHVDNHEPISNGHVHAEKSRSSSKSSDDGKDVHVEINAGDALGSVVVTTTETAVVDHEEASHGDVETSNFTLTTDDIPSLDVEVHVHTDVHTEEEHHIEDNDLQELVDQLIE